MPRHGTWTETSGGGFDAGGLIQVAAIVAAAVCAVMIIMEFAWLIITLGVVAVAARLWLLHRRTVAIAQIAAQGARIREEQQAHAAARLAGQRAHELEVARVSAPVIQPVIQNIIDPAMITAALVAAVTGAQPQPVRVIPAIAEEVHDGR